ncbi:MAG TPA: hypothetical protein VG294_12375 [Solirubrobacteraceae bacterium]|nr:hypothetical protein [Solirubrobacteraceae bacterium]
MRAVTTRDQKLSVDDDPDPGPGYSRCDAEVVASTPAYGPAV